jgi:hypothetical protein
MTMFFPTQKLFSFIRSHLLIIDLSVWAIGILFRKLSPMPIHFWRFLTFSLWGSVHLVLCWGLWFVWSWILCDRYGFIWNFLHVVIQFNQHHFFCFSFYLIFPLFTFQMLSSFQVSPPEPPIPFFLPLPLWGCSSTHLPTLPSSLGITLQWGIEHPLRPKGLSSHWCPTRPSSATYSARGMGPSMYNLWLVV